MSEEIKKPALPANLEKLARSKKKPSDWVFVPRRKKFKQAPVMLKDGEVALVSDGGGALKPQTLKKPIIIKVTAVHGTDAKGALLGGYRPQKERDWSAEKVLEAMLEMSANPNCEVVPYELREVGKEAMVAEMNLVEERNRRLEAEEKLKALEDGKASDAARIKELEAALGEKKK
jgi:uncharacterized protein YcgL (UPF0745 family)